MAAIRIARIITRLNVGGPAYQALTLANGMPQRFETLLIAGQVDAGEEQFDSLIDKYPCNLRFSKHLQRRVNPIKDVLALVWLIRTLRQYRPAVVHTHTAKAGTLGRLAARIVGCPVIVHTFHGHVLQGYFSGFANRCIASCERQLGRFSDAIVAISPKLADELASYLGKAVDSKLHVINLGVPLEGLGNIGRADNDLRQRLGISPRAVVFGTLGRLVAIKDHQLMINAFAQALGQLGDQDLHLLIGGSGPLQQGLEAQAGRAGLDRRVHFLGVVDDLVGFYAAIDAGVLTSVNEGTPVMLLEATAAGKFVIASAVGGVPDVVPADGGTLVSSRNVEDFARAMVEFVQNRPAGLSDQQRAKVVEQFSTDRLIQKIAVLYDKLLEQKGFDGA